MDFEFSPEQVALRTAVAEFVDHWTISHDARNGLADAHWRELVDLGWPALLVPEVHGGLGRGLVDAVGVLEAMGRVAFPGPFLASAGLATIAARRLDLFDRFGGLVTGVQGAVALEESGHGDPVDRVRTRASRRGAEWRLVGEKPLVFAGPETEWVLIAARTAAGLESFRVDTPSTTPVPTMDATRSVARLALDDTVAFPVGPDGDHTAIWRTIADDTAVLLAAELVGVCDAAVAMGMEYAQQRVQFDQPIAAHQVIQHKLVDMLHATELARVAVHYAAWASDVDDPDRARAAAIAKAQSGEAAVMVTAENIQIHGAVGFTWESRAGVLYQRAKQNDVLGGSSGWHRRRVADLFLGTP